MGLKAYPSSRPQAVGTALPIRHAIFDAVTTLRCLKPVPLTLSPGLAGNQGLTVTMQAQHLTVTSPSRQSSRQSSRQPYPMCRMQARSDKGSKGRGDGTYHLLCSWVRRGTRPWQQPASLVNNPANRMGMLHPLGATRIRLESNIPAPGIHPVRSRTSQLMSYSSSVVNDLT
ncbi:hypothetical protein AUP68_12687 [Ilyonectria robusta]